MRVETGMEDSEGDSARGEKDPGIVCRTGFGNTKEVAVGLPMFVLRSKELLEEASDSGRGGSGSEEGCFVGDEESFLTNRPDASRGGRLGCLGIRLVTKGDHKEEDVG